MKNLMFVVNSKIVSGAEISLKGIILSLNKDEFNVFLAINPENKIIDEVSDDCTVVEVPFEFFARKISFRYFFVVLKSLIISSKILNKFIKNNKIDIIICNSTKSCIYGFFLKLVSNKKMIWIVRDNLESNILAFFLSLFSDKIICTSGFLKAQLKFQKYKIKIIGNFIRRSNPLLTGKREDDRILSSDKVIIGNIGQFIPWKNQYDSLLAFHILSKKNSNICMVFVGSFFTKVGEIYLEKLIQYVKMNQLEERVFFLEQFENIDFFLDKIHLLLHSAIGEPFGRVIIEAMSHGVPVVAYNNGGPSEIITNLEDGLLVGLNEKSKGLANALEGVLKYTSLRNSLSINAKEKINKYYTSEIIMPKFEGIFKTL